MKQAFAGGVRAEPDDRVFAMTIFRFHRRAARVSSPDEVDRGRAAAGDLPVVAMPAKGEVVLAKTQPKDIDAKSPEGDVFDVRGRAQKGTGATAWDVPIVATRGRWLGPRSLVVEVELTLPVALTLDQSAVLTESVEAAVVSVIPQAQETSYR
jgi:hypothetical protein